MESIRHLHKGIVLLVSFLLSLSLFCTQGAALLHIHDTDHDHSNGKFHDHISTEAPNHSQINKVHFALDASHLDHHDDITVEVDVSPEGVLKNSTNNILTLALLTFLLVLLLPATAIQLFCNLKKSAITLTGRYVLSPPLRAPPHI